MKTKDETQITSDIANRLTFLRLSESNIGELSEGMSELYHAVRGRKCDPSYWRWCYLENTLGKSNSIVAVRAGRVVGKFGNVYLQMIVQGERVVARLMEGLSIEPSERSWRCYTGLLRKSHAEQLKDNVAFGFALSTPLATKLTRWTGGISLGRAPVYSGFINVVRVLAGLSIPYPLSLAGWLVQPIVGLKIQRAGVSDLDIRPIQCFDNSFDLLWSNIEKSRTVSVVKDAAYLNWRYVKCPGRTYSRFAAYRAGQLKGFVVLRTTATRRDGFVLELLAEDDDPDTMKALVIRAVQMMNEQRVGLLSASFQADSSQATALKKLGFKSWGTRLWNMEITIATDPRKESCPELDPKNWNFSLGDWLYYLDPGTWY